MLPQLQPEIGCNMTQLENRSEGRFERDLARSLAKQGKALLEAADLPARVSRLEPLEVYFMVKELGLESAGPILMCASANQLQTFVDLDCWEGHDLNFADIDVWLAPFAGLGQQALVAAFLSLEDQLQALYLRDALIIFQKVDEEIPTSGRKEARNRITPDGRFVIEPRLLDDEKEIDALDLVDALYKFAGVDEAFHLILFTLSELESPLYEDALRFRANRLAELGFPEVSEAIQLFAKPVSQAPGVYIPKGPAIHRGIPAIYASPLLGAGFLSEGLRGIEDPNALKHLESSLIYIVNASVVAYGESPNNLENTQAIAARTISMIDLGIETLLGGGDAIAPSDRGLYVDGAAELLLHWPLRELFKHGFQATLEVHLAALRLAEDPVMKLWLEKHESEKDDYSEERRDRAFVTALISPRPLWAGWDVTNPDRTKGFGSIADVEVGLTRLHQIGSIHG